MKRLAAALLLSIATLVTAAPLDRTEVMVQMSEAWYTARLFHPRASVEVNAWDAAFIEALGELPAQADDANVRPVLERWLAKLDDPWTRVWSPVRVRQAPWNPRIDRAGERATIFLGDLDEGVPSGTVYARMGAIAGAVGDAAEIVFDLRPSKPEFSTMPARAIDMGNFFGTLVARSVQMPHVRTRFHSGFVSEGAAGSGGYESGWRYASLPAPFSPGGSREPRYRFLVDANTAVPMLAVALQREGRATIEGTPRTRNAYVGRAPFSTVKVGAHTLMLRTSDWDWDFAPAVMPQPAPAFVTTAELPPLAARRFAVFKTWWTIRMFFPYAALADRPWADALRPALKAVESANDEVAYTDALSRMTAYTDDGHVRVNGPATHRQAELIAPLEVQLVEGKLVVTDAGDAARAAGIAVGDVVEAIDGVASARRLEEARTARAFSGDANFRAHAPFLTRGPAGSRATLTVVGADGKPREVTLERVKSPYLRDRSAPEYRVLPSGFGYVDLRRLEVKDIDAMLEALKDTPALIMDMRGYPRRAMFFLAPRLSTEDRPVAAAFERPVVVPTAGRLGDVGEVHRFLQRLALTDKPRYTKPTVMLIDERAISQAEHSGLFARAANGTVFVGSPTAGANGDVTSFRLPGQLWVSFTGHDVRWPDGTRLQRVGLKPDVPAAPTIAGIRAGRDEVLQAAEDYLRKRAAR